MKSLFTTTMLFVLFASYAQQPFGKNATWHFEFYEFGFTGYIKIQYQKDTLINGDTWQWFEHSGIKHIKTGPNWDDVMQWPMGGSSLLKTRNDTVFGLAFGLTYPLFVLNQTVGSRWTFAPFDTTMECTDSSIATITGIGYDTIQGYPMKYYQISHPAKPSYYLTGNKIYHDLGLTFYNTLFSPTQNPCFLNLTMNWYQLRCFSNDSVNINFGSQACDYWSLISVDEFAQNKVSMYPNPAATLIYLQLPQVAQDIRILNSVGQTVQYVAVQKDLTMNIEVNLANGLYFVQVQFEDGTISRQKLMVSK